MVFASRWGRVPELRTTPGITLHYVGDHHGVTEGPNVIAFAVIPFVVISLISIRSSP